MSFTLPQKTHGLACGDDAQPTLQAAVATIGRYLRGLSVGPHQHLNAKALLHFSSRICTSCCSQKRSSERLNELLFERHDRCLDPMDTCASDVQVLDGQLVER